MNVHVPVLTIGRLAKAAGVTTPTIRYYEEIGLLPPPGRRESGQRMYTERDLERLTFIRRSRDFGFSIEQVRTLVGLSISRSEDCTQVRDIAQGHLDEVRSKLDELKALEGTLDRFVKQCDAVCAGGAGRDCAIFRDMSNPASSACC